ncbi:Protein of unknown function [Catalinimonas alkaloidigena]|uniref:DUF4199 domain-containing protein n=1 Tax=Catalinimonas alkaloidigena TaxID=1075417 RepID=A0A1G8Y8B6_9BACT|nr:DUF4199 domain-containing protein [Catalinimonas alkaloidigena]SDJ99052.1 Protein of unknown function [Catalinimonas alkaloidigena]
MKKYRTELKWAFLFAGVALLWMVLERLAGLHDRYIAQHAIYTNFFAIPAIALYVLALLDKRRNDYGGVMTYKQGLVSGLVLTLFIALLSPLTQWITSTVITPQYFPNVIAYAVATGEMEPAEAEAYFSLGNYVLQSVIGALLMGAFTSAIVAFFVKRAAPLAAHPS